MPPCSATPVQRCWPFQALRRAVLVGASRHERCRKPLHVWVEAEAEFHLKCACDVPDDKRSVSTGRTAGPCVYLDQQGKTRQRCTAIPPTA
jgi:hypothetical protein